MVVSSNFDYSSAYLYGSIGFRGYYSFLFSFFLISMELQDSDPLMSIPIAKIKATLVDKYRISEYATKAKDRIREISSIVSIYE